MTIWKVSSENHELGYCSSKSKVIELLRKHALYLAQYLENYVDKEEELDYKERETKAYEYYIACIEKMEQEEMTLEEFAEIWDNEGVYIEEIELDVF